MGDSDVAQAKRILEIFRETDETSLFRGCSMKDLDDMAQVFKFITFKE
jgi:hypothetical protein